MLRRPFALNGLDYTLRYSESHVQRKEGSPISGTPLSLVANSESRLCLLLWLNRLVAGPSRFYWERPEMLGSLRSLGDDG